ncbi:hypothetical protein FGO68_gene37 [Halteria grandinella]|uniref:Uncharacterized protein n=1 Tax=Halteria grandinella TaxID=5974 RepID=A0A8J8T6Q6_HALGN|nr:hypothetical protein FGO68_gene37 [Halteria grandinella]
MIENLNLINFSDSFKLKFEDINRKYSTTKFTVIFDLDFSKTSLQTIRNQYPGLIQQQYFKICLYNANKKLTRQYRQVFDLFTEVQDWKIQNLVFYKMKQLYSQQWEQATGEESLKLFRLLCNIQAIHGDKFKIQEIDFTFANHQSLDQNLKLAVECLYVDTNLIKYETISMPLISQYFCKEKLVFEIESNAKILKSSVKSDCPRKMIIQFFDPKSALNWETITGEILDSLSPSEIINELQIFSVYGYGQQQTLQNIQTLYIIYKFIQDCPSIEKLIIPYTNDSLILRQLIQLIKSKRTNLKYLHIQYIKSSNDPAIAQILPELYQIFADCCMLMHQLRHVIITMPNGYFQGFGQFCSEKLKVRTIPLSVKLSYQCQSLKLSTKTLLHINQQ